MKLNEAREYYYFFTGKTSEIVRQLALAGIAVIWIFKIGQNQIPSELLLPLGLIAVTLILDFFQYFTAATIWGVYSRHKEKVCEEEKASKASVAYTRLRGRNIARQVRAQKNAEFEFEAPRVMNWPAIIFFYSKSVSLIAAYWFLFEFIYPKILK